jgi:predicted nucleic acid-binding protein
MAYLFNTDIVSAILRPRPDVALLRQLATIPAEEQFTSAITLGELIFGAMRRGRGDLLQRILELTDVVPVIGFDERAAHLLGEIKAKLEQDGTPMAEPDLRIAAIALAADLTLVTRIARHFARVPTLRIEDWLPLNSACDPGMRQVSQLPVPELRIEDIP